MSAETIALIQSTTNGLRRRPDVVQMIAILRAATLLARAQASDGDPIAAALADFAEAVGERLTGIIGDIAEMARSAAMSDRVLYDR
jgi:hypothetical protein